MLFPKPEKNRRFNKHEWQHELDVARAFKRPLRTYKDDPPFYPYCVPEPKVNFDLYHKF